MPRFHKGELSASHAIRRLLEIGVTETKEILWLLHMGSRGNWSPVLDFFHRRKIRFPSMLPWSAEANANLVRVVRQQVKAGYKPEPRRQRGSVPLAKKKKPGRPKVSKSAKIRALLEKGLKTEHIVRLLKVSPALVRMARHRSK